ncbi:MAG: Nif3-like dinuclear metal center hexameric protein [Spirochaetaceae bacterium]
MKLCDLEYSLTKKLDMEPYNSTDPSLNGVQVGDLEMDIKKVALMVDASLEGFKQAKKQGADLILCHHGLFWGKPLAIKGNHYTRVKYLIENKLALFAAHLPLDAHMELGNNIGLAKQLNLINIEPFGKYKSFNIGVKGQLVEPKPVDDIKKILLGDHEPVFIIPGGKNRVSTIAIVSGGSPYSVEEAITQNIDLFITGDRSHEVYHKCLEENINMLCAGHYATETLGVKQTGQWITKEFGIETLFIDIPTGA